MNLDCPICLSPSRLDQECKDARIHFCEACCHRFSDLSSLRNVENYGPDYYEKNWFQNDNVQLFDMICKLLDRLNPDASILDVGCGNGAFLRYLHRKSPHFSLTGVDLAPNQPTAGIDFIQGDILKTEFPKKYDGIVTLAVIEHLDDVRSFTKRVFELCAPGGTAVIMTMNDTSLLYEIARTMKSLGFRLPTDQLYSSHHLNHFSTKSLRRLIEVSGFSAKRTVMHDIPLNAVDISSNNPLLTAVMRTGVWGIFTLGRWTQKTYLQTIVCEKPTA